MTQKLPYHFEWVRNRRPDSRDDFFPLTYDVNTEMFTIATKDVALHEFDLYTFNYLEMGLSGKGIEINDALKYPALLPVIGNVILGPKLHEFAKEYPQEITDTANIMRTAFSSFLEDPSQVDDMGGHLGFAAGLRRDEGIHLQVMGNCACMGPDPNGIFPSRFEEGFAEYFLHNADSQAQRASLYAGIGHIARLASEQQS